MRDQDWHARTGRAEEMSDLYRIKVLCSRTACAFSDVEKSHAALELKPRRATVACPKSLSLRQASMASLLSALAPKAEFSFADVVEEVRRLRDENELLKAQVEMLSQNRLNPGSAAAAPAAADASSNGSTALAGTDGDGSAAGAFQSLRKELAVNLGADPAEASSSQVKALQQQLVASREQLSWLQIARGVDALAIAAELHEAEGALLWLRRERAAQQAVCEELEAAVQQQASLARQAQQVAVAESRQQMAASHAALEEQCMALQEELDRRQALQEQFGVEEELEARQPHSSPPPPPRS